MRGCELCARQTVMQYKEEDAKLLRMFRRARNDVKKHLEKNGYAGLADPPTQEELQEMLKSK